MMEKTINFYPKKLNTESDIDRHSKILEQLGIMYEGVQLYASISIIGSILCFCGDDENEVAVGNPYFERGVEAIFNKAMGLKMGFMDIMSHCVDLNHRGIVLLHDIGDDKAGYEFSKDAFDRAIKSFSVH